MTSVNRIGENEYMSYAVANLPAKSDQDKFTIRGDHTSDGLQNFASFAVFDGHLEVIIFLVLSFRFLLKNH